MQAYACGRRWKILFTSEEKFYLPPDVGIALRAYSERMADIRVLIVDDMEGVRQDLRTFLTLAGGLEIVGEARDGSEAVRLAEALRPQVILMDLEMPVMDGYAATRQIKAGQPSCRVIVLTIHADPVEHEGAMNAGADSFIVKGASLDTLMDAIRNVPTLGEISKGEKS